MPRNGTGTFTVATPPGYPQTGQTASAVDMTTILTDMVSGFTLSTAADGQTPITGNWDWKGYDIGNVATMSAAAGVFTAMSTSGGATIGNALVVTKGGATITAGGVTVTAGGATVTGDSAITGALTISTAATKGTQAVNYSQFPATIASPGTTTLPNGLILKWGTGTTTLGSGNVAFAAAFPTACLNVQITINGGTVPSTLNPLFTATVNTTGFDVRGDAGQSLTFYWLAIGH